MARKSPASLKRGLNTFPKQGVPRLATYQPSLLRYCKGSVPMWRLNCLENALIRET